MEENKSAYDRVMEKAAEKKQAAKERKEVREESGIVNKLVIERTPVGLYQARYSMRGQVPDDLKGLFTRKERILTIAKQKGIEVENAA
jgi:cell division protein FtsL